MAYCEGRGDCIQQCVCVCYDDEYNNILSEVCSCGHRTHTIMFGGDSEYKIYCKTDCPYNCELVECHNYRMCRQKRPQNILDCDNGMCKDCAIMIGRITFLDEKDDCPVCLDNKDMIEISCEKHKVCLDCWKSWSETSIQSSLTCKLCYDSIWE